MDAEFRTEQMNAFIDYPLEAFLRREATPNGFVTVIAKDKFELYKVTLARMTVLYERIRRFISLFRKVGLRGESFFQSSLANLNITQRGGGFFAEVCLDDKLLVAEFKLLYLDPDSMPTTFEVRSVASYRCTPIAAFFLARVRLYAFFCKLERFTVKDGEARRFSSLSELYSSAKQELEVAVKRLDVFVSRFDAAFKQELIDWNKSIDSNFSRLGARIALLVRKHRQSSAGMQRKLFAMELKLFYMTRNFEEVKCPPFEQVKRDLQMLLRGSKHRDLNRQIEACVWKIKYEGFDMVKAHGIQLHLLLFASLEVPLKFLLNDRKEALKAAHFLREQLGQRWVTEIVANSQGGYAAGRGMEKEKNPAVFPLVSLDINDCGWRREVDKLVCNILLQDYFLRIVLDEKASDSHSKSGKKVRPRTFEFLGFPKEKTRLAAKSKVGKARSR